MPHSSKGYSPNIFLVQRVIPHYRIAPFQKLYSSFSNYGYNLRFLIGTSSVRKASTVDSIYGYLPSTIQLPSFTFKLGSYELFVFPYLLQYLLRERPSIVITEGLSCPFSVAIVLIYKIFFNPSALSVCGLSLNFKR